MTVLLNVGDQVRLVPDFPPGAMPLRWQTVDSLSANFATLDGFVVSRRALEGYIEAGRVEVREVAPDPSWLLAQAAACMIGIGFRALSDSEERA